MTLKHASSKRIWVLGIAMAATVQLLFLFLSADQPVTAGPTWKRAGDGNLKAVQIRGETLLVSESQDLTPYLDIRKKGYRTIAAYRPDRAEPVPAESVVMSFRDRQGEPIDITCVRVNGVIASCDENRARFGRSPDGGRIFLETGEALWVAAADGTGWKDVSGPGYEEAMNRYMQLWNLPDEIAEESLPKEARDAVARLRMRSEPSGASNESGASKTTGERRPGMVTKAELLEALPENGPLNWVSQSMWLDDRRIVFASNRDRFPWRWESGIWVVDVETGQLEKWMDGEKEGSLYPIFAKEEKVIVYGGNRDLYDFHVKTRQVQKYAIHGTPISVSPNGRYVLYNPVNDDSVVKSDIVILDLQTSEQTLIPHKHPYYVFMKGDWDFSNSRFAFYAQRGDKEYGGELFILNVKTKKLDFIPSITEMGKIDPNGALSWLESDQVVVSTTEKGSWILDVRLGGDRDDIKRKE